MKKLEADLLIGGRELNVYLLRRGNRCWGEEFLKGLPLREKMGIKNIIERVADGLSTGREMFKFLRDKIYEFRYRQTRLLCFRIDNNLYITHGIKKKQDKVPSREIEKAIRLMKEFMEG